MLNMSGTVHYPEFISSFDDHSSGNKKLTKATDPVAEKGRSYRGLNFFAKRDLRLLETIGRGDYMTFGMQGKDIRQYLREWQNFPVSIQKVLIYGIS